MAKTATLTLADEPAAPLSQATPPAPTKLGLTDKVPTNKGEFTIQELLESKHQLEQAKELLSQYQSYRGAVQNLINSDVKDQGVRARSLRHILDAEGYSPQEIEAQVVALTGGGTMEPAGDDGQEEEPDEEAPAPTARQLQRAAAGYDNPELTQMRGHVDELLQELNRTRVSILRKEMGEQVAAVLDSDPDIAKLVKKVKDIRGEDAEEGLKILREDISQKAVQALSKKVALTGQKVQDDWVEDAVKQAAKEVRSRSLFGNPDMIGRAPTVAGGNDTLLNRKPVDPPAFKKGDSMAGVANKVKDYGVDLLTRLAAQNSPGDTKV